MLRNYLLNSSLHGLHFLADRKFHWSEKVFWTICVIFSWAGSLYLMYSSYQQSMNNAVSFTADTNYLHWAIPFPAIVFCERGNNNAHKYADVWFGKDRDYDIDSVLEDIAFFQGKSSYQLQKCVDNNYKDEKKCPMGNFRFYSNSIRSNCSELFSDCYYNTISRVCCEHILPLETIFGVCYAITSILTKTPVHNPTISRKINTNGQVTMSVSVKSRNMFIFALSGEGVPTYHSGMSKIYNPLAESSFEDSRDVHFYLSIRPMANSPDVLDLSIKQRECRFPEENPLKGVKYYSYSSCISQCVIEYQRKHCGCILHLTPGANEKPEKEICTLEGLHCISNLYEHLLAHTASCNCEISCTEPLLRLIGTTTNYLDNAKKQKSTFYFHLGMPYVRDIRVVVHGKMDIIVSLGGTAALFMGASLLTIVELFDYFLLNPLLVNLKKKFD